MITIVGNRKAVISLLKSTEIQGVIDDIAASIQRAAGAEDHRVETQMLRFRYRAAVLTDTYKGHRGEALHHNLTRSLDAGRR